MVLTKDIASKILQRNLAELILDEESGNGPYCPSDNYF
jgi:hypothetical protein